MIELKASRRAADGERIAHFFTSDFTFGDEFRGVFGVFFFFSPLLSAGRSSRSGAVRRMNGSRRVV